MSVAPILGLRRAIVTHLRDDASVTALGTPALASDGKVRIYGEKTPTTLIWPFVRYGESDAVPGFDITAPIHAFSKAEFTDEVGGIAEAIGASLNLKVLILGDGRRAWLAYLGHQILRDGAEASAWHSIIRIGANVITECPA